MKDAFRWMLLAIGVLMLLVAVNEFVLNDKPDSTIENFEIHKAPPPEQ
jgi:hypothetical protein